MQTIKVIGDNTEVIIDNEGITIHGNNIRINEVTEEQSTKDLQEFLDECRECINKCGKCSAGFDAEKFITELRDNADFQNVILQIMSDNLFMDKRGIKVW